MHELQALGERLITMKDSFVAALPIPDELLQAIRDARLMNKRGALHRQKQLIGKLMRQVDAEPIRLALEKLKDQARIDAARFHIVENWRDRLLREGDTALEKLLTDYPDADRQHLRQIMRDAARERERNLPPKSARKLFRYIKDLMAMT
ncbi:MAG: DUF615 domain-containing protein [Gammaproteobacteria bacterium]|nr:DUF615 domain-containing protein [Gammaproteobacteria bacterium]